MLPDRTKPVGRLREMPLQLALQPWYIYMCVYDFSLDVDLI
uniref:Uncharacterized protein n=1 Tax=Rhizophora mucronata TaxID=61149 RepID=A0A2P2QYX7_RHIMU